MKIYNEREELYDQMEREKRENQRLSVGQKHTVKNQSAEPVVRGHMSQQSNIMGGPNVKASPYTNGVNITINQ